MYLDFFFVIVMLEIRLDEIVLLPLEVEASCMHWSSEYPRLALGAFLQDVYFEIDIRKLTVHLFIYTFYVTFVYLKKVPRSGTYDRETTAGRLLRFLSTSHFSPDISSCDFGGRNYKTLHLSSAR